LDADVSEALRLHAEMKTRDTGAAKMRLDAGSSSG